MHGLRHQSAEERLETNSMPLPWSGCWIWMRDVVKGGYGRTWFKGQRYLAHRLSFQTYKGPIPDGLDVCHSCDTPPCINPDHLFAGTESENIQDSIRKGRLTKNRVIKTHCPQGHEYAGDNLVIRIKSGATNRECRICMRLNNRIRWRRWRLRHFPPQPCD